MSFTHPHRTFRYEPGEARTSTSAQLKHGLALAEPATRFVVKIDRDGEIAAEACGTARVPAKACRAGVHAVNDEGKDSPAPFVIRVADYLFCGTAVRPRVARCVGGGGLYDEDEEGNIIRPWREEESRPGQSRGAANAACPAPHLLRSGWRKSHSRTGATRGTCCQIREDSGIEGRGATGVAWWGCISVGIKRPYQLICLTLLDHGLFMLMSKEVHCPR
ncbi:hypothetical protein B0H11DRAFT_583094 [Mycena galericulata]|nr:hypothetical protein B0H11DRAFT_583094 [Mycena galericulata]